MPVHPMQTHSQKQRRRKKILCSPIKNHEIGDKGLSKNCYRHQAPLMTETRKYAAACEEETQPKTLDAMKIDKEAYSARNKYKK